MSQILTTLEAKTEVVLDFLEDSDVDVLYIAGGGMTGKTTAVIQAVKRLPADYPNPVIVCDNGEPFRIVFTPARKQNVAKTIIISCVNHYHEFRDALDMSMGIKYIEFTR